MAGGASTSNGTVMAMLKGNVSGQVQQIPPVTLNGARERTIIETVALAAQAAGAKVAVARLPLGAALLGIAVASDAVATLATLAFGDYTDDALYAVAAVAGAINTIKNYDIKAAALGVPIVTGYDSTSGAQKGYQEIIMTSAAAALPAAGVLRVITRYVID